MARVSILSAAAGIAVLMSSSAALDKKLYGINYDLRQNPDWDPSKCKSAETIEAELLTLSVYMSSVRTYSLSDCDVTSVLKAAKKMSITVWLGVWVSEDKEVYKAEVKAFEQLLRSGLIDSNVVGINVGSEAVYRNDITAEQSIEYVTQFKKVLADNDIRVPISITDIADTFIQYPEMLKAGDIVTINQFPFWEKVEASKAAAHFDKRIEPLLKMTGDMEVIVTETGWPTDGFAVNGSVASAENAAIYLKDFYELAESKGWKYYYFVGFDTPYKAKQVDDATTVESHFGIFDEAGRMKPAYESLTLTTKGDSSTLEKSVTTASFESSSASVDPGTVTAATDVADDDSRIKTQSSLDADETPSSTITNEDSGSLQLAVSSITACLCLVVTMIWTL
uniref:glucan endo-1,3-beta-D-glucosidase n=1 Tax=Peronospora matthiolae TaxID=2874970 RepID=A0AAV1V4H0_9STRA